MLPVNQPPLSPADVYGGRTTPSLGAVNNNQIAAWVQARLNAPGTPEQKARDLVVYMQTNGLTPERVAIATGYPIKNVMDAIALAGPAQKGGIGPLLLAVGAYLLLGA